LVGLFVCVCVFVCLCGLLVARKFVFVCLLVGWLVCLCVCVCVGLFVCVYMYIYMCVCIYVLCMYVHVCVYIYCMYLLCMYFAHMYVCILQSIRLFVTISATHHLKPPHNSVCSCTDAASQQQLIQPTQYSDICLPEATEDTTQFSMLLHRCSQPAAVDSANAVFRQLPA